MDVRPIASSSLYPFPTQARQARDVGIEHVWVGVVKVIGNVFLELGTEIWAGFRPFDGEREKVFLWMRCQKTVSMEVLSI